MKQIVVLQPGSLSNEDKLKLESYGVIVIEHHTPSEVKVFSALDVLSQDDVINSMIAGLSHVNPMREFGEQLAKRIKEKQKNV